MDGVTAIILAAGEGKRMRSRRPKVLHPLCGRPLIDYALRAAHAVADRLVMVVSPGADDVVAAAGAGIVAVEQRERLGTGHAVLQARTAGGDAQTILVLPGDMPLLTAETFERLVLGHLDPADPFVSTLDTLVAARRRYPGTFPDVERWLTTKLQGHVKQFLARIATMAPTP